MDPIEALINRCSTFAKLKRLTAWLLSLEEKLRAKDNTTSLDAKLLSVFDLKRAETEFVKFVQRKAFPYLFSNTNGDQISRQCPQYMKKSRPFIFEGVTQIKTKYGMLKRPITKLCNINTHSRSLDKTVHNDLDDFTLANLKV